MFDWPHSPPHRFASDGVYFITAGTYLKQHHFRRRDDLNRLMALLFSLAREHAILLQAWAIFSNHYHLVAQGAGESLREMITSLHSQSARELNARHGIAGRQVWYQCRDTQLTFERSWLARLRYTNANAVKHGLVRTETEYPWCSAAWFERTASPAFVRTVESFRIDRVNVPDSFEVEPILD
jgi:putative transposase